MLDSETTFSHFQARIGGFRPGSQAAASCFAELSSGSITMYRRLPHLVDAMCRGLAAANINAECPSGNAPTTRVRLRISRIIRSSGLLTAMIRGGCLSVPVDPRPPRNRRHSRSPNEFLGSIAFLALVGGILGFAYRYFYSRGPRTNNR
jgi:hypothetical protein